MSHTRIIVDGMSNAEVARRVASLRYEDLHDFMWELHDCLCHDAKQDRKAGRRQLADRLYDAAAGVWRAAHAIGAAWEVCKPFVERDDRVW